MDSVCSSGFPRNHNYYAGDKRLQTFFQRHGNQAVFFARFITGVRFMAGPMAGAAGMRFWCFFGWDLFGAFIWCSVMITIGYFVGKQLDRVAHVVHSGGQWIAITGLLVAPATWLLWRYRRHRRGSEARAVRAQFSISEVGIP